jgi:hypothetical protein
VDRQSAYSGYLDVSLSHGARVAHTGVSTNFYVNELGMSGSQVLWLNGHPRNPRIVPDVYRRLGNGSASCQSRRGVADLDGHWLWPARSGAFLRGIDCGGIDRQPWFSQLDAIGKLSGFGPIAQRQVGASVGVAAIYRRVASIVGIGLITITGVFHLAARLLCGRRRGDGAGRIVRGPIARNIGNTSKEKPRLLMKKRLAVLRADLFRRLSRAGL